MQVGGKIGVCINIYIKTNNALQNTISKYKSSVSVIIFSDSLLYIHEVGGYVHYIHVYMFTYSFLSFEERHK